MQAGSFVAAAASPTMQSTRQLAQPTPGSWKAKVDRQLSLDRSAVSISGSFPSHTPTASFSNAVSQVSAKTAPGNSALWTPAPPRSPRQRSIHSPLRWNGPQVVQQGLSSAMVVTRDTPDDASVEYTDRLARIRSMDLVPQVPFLSMPSPQLHHPDKTPKRSCSPPSLKNTTPNSTRRPSFPTTTITRDNDGSACEMSLERIGSSFHSPTQHQLTVPRIAWQQTAQAAAEKAQAARSPRRDAGRPGSPFRWKSQEESNLVNKASAAPWPIPVQSVTSQRGSRMTREAAPAVRARTVSPARRPPDLIASSFASVLSKDTDDMPGKASRNTLATVLSTERQGEQSVRLHPRSAAVSVAAAPVKDDSRLSRPSMMLQPTDEALRRPQAFSAVLPPKDLEVLEPAEQGPSTSYLDLKPWLEAAASFQLNTDFALPEQGKIDFNTLMGVMKKESASRWTIQTMADKLLLNGLLENLGLPHMPMIFASRSLAKLRDRLEVLVDKLIIATAKKQPYDIIVKPTHLSSAQGVMSFNKVHAPGREDTIRQLENHMRKFIETQANVQESAALQSLKPGFIGQPKYKSVVGFKAPLELKVCALWGKVRSGVWWWGTRMAGPAQVPHRNVWIVRDPVVPGELNDNDGWEVLHNHPGGNAGHEKAVQLFKRHMPQMAALAESLAVALGTPFLRADFFVGSAKWGIRLNEVAYGCGLEYRSFLREGNLLKIIDDKPAMSEILRQGMALCHRRIGPEHFLRRLGVQGTTYEDTAVVPLNAPLTTFSSTMNSQPDHELQEYAVEENLCRSMKELPLLENDPTKENHSKHLDPHYVMRKQSFVKPHLSHIPTLMMPGRTAVIANNGYVQHIPPPALKAPVPVVPCGMQYSAQPRAAQAIMLRGPLR